MKRDVCLILGSDTDKDKANKMLEIWKELGMKCSVNIASCHRNIGGDFEKFVAEIGEDIIVFLGGMELAAPGIIESLLRNAKKFDQIVFGIPTDKAARSAIENLPRGTAVITSGLNEISLTHSLVNSALAVAKLAGMITNPKILASLGDYYIKIERTKPLIKSLTLVDGLIQV